MRRILAIDIGGTTVKLMISRTGKTEIRIRPEAFAPTTDCRRQRISRRLEIRCDLDRFSVRGPGWPDRERSKAFEQRLGRMELQEIVR